MEYLLKSMICLLVLLLIYRVWLQNEALYRFNRLYLLGAVVFSFLIPLHTVERVVSVPSEPQTQVEFSGNELPTLVEADPVFSNDSEQMTPSGFSWEDLAWAVYMLISLFFLIRFVRNLKLLMDRINQNMRISYRNQTLILLSEKTIPFTFFRNIFVNKEDFENGRFSDAVFEHELAHVKGHHSWDIFLIELLLIPLWFHPGLHWAKQSIQLNHEFIADQHVLKKWPTYKYQQQLLHYATSAVTNSLVCNLNFSLTKKRLKMMTKKTKPTIQFLKITLLLPVIGLAIYGFSEKRVVEKPISNEIASESAVLVNQIASDSFSKENQDIQKAEYYSNTRFFLKYPDGKTSELSYQELSDKQKKGLPDPLQAPEKKRPSEEVFQSWKNQDQFALWLDGKVIPNSQLQNISIQEIAYFSSSFVHTNARSERFPQEYQVSLFTEKGYESTYGESSDFGRKPLGGIITIKVDEPQTQSFSVNSNPLWIYQQDLLAYEEKLKKGVHFIEKSEAEQEEIIEEFLDLGGRYFRLQAGEKPKANRPIHPFSPYIQLEKEGEIYYKLPSDLTDEERSALPAPPPIVPENKSLSLASYEKIYHAYELARNQKQHFIFKSKQEQELLTFEYEKVRNAYQGLDLFDKKRSQSPSNPSDPYVKIKRAGKDVFVLPSELTAADRAAMGC